MKITLASEYILEADRGSDGPTVFAVRRLTWEQLAQVRELAPFDSPQQFIEVQRITEPARREGRQPNADELERLLALMPDWATRGLQVNRMMARAVELGVTEIRNLQDGKGAPLQITPAEFAAIAPDNVLAELGNEVMRLATLSEDEAKNSGAPPGRGRSAARATPARGSPTTRRGAPKTSPSAG